ncbi:MAG: hypothetical protein JO038_01330 [Alphaproteobacteria bacterium]|nr:hypothetical protein [Alphaproteobacteria bacterium]
MPATDGGKDIQGEPEPNGCLFILDESGAEATTPERCGLPRESGSSYCPEHHARCHLRSGTRSARRRLRELENLARAVGGRAGSAATKPSERFLHRLERRIRFFS